MPFISVIVPTMRVGGIDVLLDSLQRQTFTDFELVLVDAIYDRRREVVERGARDRFLAVRHVGPQPSPFPMCSFCLMSNCGIAVSTGEVLLFAVDYTRFPDDLLARHARFHKSDPTGRAGMMGPHAYAYLDVEPSFPRYGHSDEETSRYERDVRSGALDRFMMSIGAPGKGPASPHDADGGAVVPFNADPKLRMPPGKIDACFFHAKNESVRRERVIEVDGYDQDLDGAHLYQDSDFADRLTLKAGVQWMLDPSAVVDIVNPRHVFPFARRARPHDENKRIWEAKRAAGYPGRPNSVLVGLKMKEREQPLSEGGVGAVVETVRPGRKLRVGMIYGEFSSAIHGPFDIDGLYTKVGLTGSEGSFFNLARSLSERGHEVAVFCVTDAEHDHPSGFRALPIRMLQSFPKVSGADAVIAWNEPDYLQFSPPGAKRFCDQQLNDFGYCRRPDWKDLAHVWVSPSENHRANVMEKEGISGSLVIPNSVDLDLFRGGPDSRSRNRVVWCSSPDRGLHHLLSFWPEVRQRVPDAELRIFYRLRPWLDRMRGADDEQGRRARYVEEAIEKLRRLGVSVYDSVPNQRMAHELRGAACLAYPCDPVRYTEGFGCSVLDAAAAGCLPIISSADALPSVHGSAAVGIPGPPQHQRAAWVEAISVALTHGAPPGAAERMSAHARAHSRDAVADKWEALLQR